MFLPQLFPLNYDLKAQFRSLKFWFFSSILLILHKYEFVTGKFGYKRETRAYTHTHTHTHTHTYNMEGLRTWEARPLQGPNLISVSITQ